MVQTPSGFTINMMSGGHDPGIGLSCNLLAVTAGLHGDHLQVQILAVVMHHLCWPGACSTHTTRPTALFNATLCDAVVAVCHNHRSLVGWKQPQQPRQVACTARQQQQQQVEMAVAC